jgi:hypothetical protein
MQLIENQMDATIMTAFPQYNDIDIDNWTLNRTARIFAMAEWSLRELRGVPIEIRLEDPSPKKQPQQHNPVPVQQLQNQQAAGLPEPPDPEEIMRQLGYA